MPCVSLRPAAICRLVFAAFMIPHLQQIGQGQPVFHQNAGCISTAFSEIYTISSPLTGLCALGWSMLNPSMSQRYCWGVSARASLSLRGHWKLPLSNRLCSSTKPLPSQYRALIRSRRRPQNRNSVLLNGSRSNSSRTSADSPSIPCRRSVYPQQMYTFSAPVKSLNMTSLHAERPLPWRRLRRYGQQSPRCRSEQSRRYCLLFVGLG